MATKEGGGPAAEVELLRAMIAELQRRIGTLEATNAEFSMRAIHDRRKRKEAEDELRRLRLRPGGGEA